MVKRPDGKPIERSGAQKPNCKLCKKFDNTTGKVWEGFIPRNIYYFEAFLIARAFNVLPKIGGIDQQDPFVMSIFILLNMIFDKADELRIEAAQFRILGRLAGG